MEYVLFYLSWKVDTKSYYGLVLFYNWLHDLYVTKVSEIFAIKFLFQYFVFSRYPYYDKSFKRKRKKN